jgi:CarD family transcriptional regulator
MSNFKIGDKIIYPNQGVGVIEDIQVEDCYGQEYIVYHVRILANNTLVLVPSTSIQDMGIRKPVSKEAIEEIFELLKNGQVEINNNWKGRYKEHAEMMQSGEIKNVALVLKNLYQLNQVKPLSFREKKMLEKAKQLLVTELSEAGHLPPKEVEKKLMENLVAGLNNRPPHLDS